MQGLTLTFFSAGVTQECLAELLSVLSQTLSNIKRWNQQPFAVTKFVEISQLLEANSDDLLAGLPVPNSRRMERIKKELARRRVSKITLI
jgi:hypothetical protein